MYLMQYLITFNFLEMEKKKKYQYFLVDKKKVLYL